MTRPVSEAAMRARFEHHTRPVDGGHIEWDGPNQIAWRGRKWRPAALAYYLHTGRHPDGYTRADCGHDGCVKPGHVDDGAGRRQVRQTLRALLGIPNQPACRRGHDQATHGRYRPTGIAYCEACRTERKTAATERTTQ